MIVSRHLPAGTIILLLFFLSFSSLDAQESRFSIISPRNAALGGLHAGLTDQFSTIFNNPAGFRGVTSDFTVSEISLKISKPVSAMILASQGGDLTSLFEGFGSTSLAVALSGPISFGRIKNNMAWGVYNVLDTEIFIPDITEDATAIARFDLGGVYGYSFGVDFLNSNNQMNFGFLIKLFYRSESNFVKSFEDIISTFGEPETIPLDMGFGTGLDLGIKYIWNETLSFGIAVRDIYTPLFMWRYDSISTLASGGSPVFEYQSLKPDYSFGVVYSPDLVLFKGLLGNIKILFDYNDIFDFALNPEYARHFILHMGFGLEFTLFDILAVRLGFYEGLPSAGAGLDLHMFKFNFTLFGSELSTMPGLMPVYNLMLGIEFSY